MIFQGTVHNMAVPLQRTSVSLPFAVCGWQEPQPADLPYERVIAELATAGVVWNSAPEVVLDDDALGLRMAAPTSECSSLPTSTAPTICACGGCGPRRPSNDIREEWLRLLRTAIPHLFRGPAIGALRSQRKPASRLPLSARVVGRCRGSVRALSDQHDEALCLSGVRSGQCDPVGQGE